MPPSSAPIEIAPLEATVGGSGAQKILFTLRNRGQTPVRVTQVVPHCGCTVVEPADSLTVPAGGESKLRVLATPPEVGTRRTSIDVHNEGQGDSPLSVILFLKGPEPSVPTLAFEPREVIVRGFVHSAAHTDFHLTAVENKAGSPWIDGLESDAAEVSAAILSFEDTRGPTDDTVRRKYQCRVSAQLGSRGRTRLAAVKLRCMAPASGASPQPIRVMSDCIASVEAIPDTIFASVAEEDVPRDFAIRFRSVSLGDSLTIEPQTSARWLEIEGRAAPPAGSPFAAELRIRLIKLPESQGDSPSRATVVVKTNAPDCPIVEIPFVVRRRD
ncbi:MAG TPA: DUF1573 domain-containing protein [Pirellulales bacterium]|nr:DUF1573 domain-containing protein [Pirellulales bacterium]